MAIILGLHFFTKFCSPFFHFEVLLKRFVLGIFLIIFSPKILLPNFSLSQFFSFFPSNLFISFFFLQLFCS
ncbi:hypothetical protein PAHAL_9G092800 [Panicum hallii]|uniref:Uncharacterized protein n=1 Tax=Panicum hallii TaxID=206008 RepID=A0A2T8I0P1_9POAL|nr:hypothetical protein PAHAL_9G092800 [Panicum hallii]